MASPARRILVSGTFLAMLTVSACAHGGVVAEDPNSANWSGMDDHCDRDLALDTVHYEARNLADAVKQADVIVEAKVLDVTTEKQMPSDDERTYSVAYTATIDPVQSFKGAPPKDPWTSQFSSDFVDRKSDEVVERIGDQHRAALKPGNEVIIFASIVGRSQSFAIQPPGPIVLTDGRASLTPCGKDAATSGIDDSLLDIDGMDEATLRKEIAAYVG